jgi:putative hemolysin
MKKTFSNKFSIFLNVILILFLIGYFLVPFLTISWLTKIFSPSCSVINAFQGDEYLAPWCEEVLIGGEGQNEEEENLNTNVNANLNVPLINENTNQNINTNTNTNTGIANPAAVKCLEAGGVSESYNTVGGEAALCVFKDKSVCEEWAYFRGECQTGKCFKKCDAIGTRSEGWYNSCTKELIKYDKCAPETVEPVKDTEVKNITVNLPVADSQLSSPFEVSGKAKVADNKVYIRVKSKSGQALIELNTSVKNISTDGFGDFKTNVNYEFSTTKEGFVDVYSINQQTQAEENLISIPVKF